MDRREFFLTIPAAAAGCALKTKAQDVDTYGPGEYAGDIVATADDTIIEGAGMPVYDGANLTGGTVIQGQINVNNKKRVIIRNLGIDVRGLGLDAIRSGTQATGERQELIIENVTLLGDGLNHGIALVSGSHNLVRNVKAYNFQHGVIFRCSHSRLDGAYCEGITIWSAGIKGAAVSGNADHCSITGLISSGPGMIAIKAESGYTANYAHVHDCHFLGGQARAVSILADPGGDVDYAQIVQVTSINSAAGLGDFVTNGANAATFIGCQAVNPAGFGFYRATPGDVQMIGCRGNVY